MEIPGITYPSSLVQCTAFELKVPKHHFDGSKYLLWECTTVLQFLLDCRNTYFACLSLLTVIAIWNCRVRKLSLLCLQQPRLPDKASRFCTV